LLIIFLVGRKRGRESKILRMLDEVLKNESFYVLKRKKEDRESWKKFDVRELVIDKIINLAEIINLFIILE